MDKKTLDKANDLTCQINDLELGLKQWEGLNDICELSFEKDSFHHLHVPLPEFLYLKLKAWAGDDLKARIEELEQQLKDL